MKILRHLALWVIVLGLGAWTVTASAASQESGAAAVAGYCQGSEFYAFVAMDAWADTLTAKVQMDGRTQPSSQEGSPGSLAETETPVSYLLLVDCSGSMRGEKSDRSPQNLVRCFAGALCDAAGGKAKFAAATFDEHFNQDATEYTDNKQEFLKNVSAIRYTAQTTNLTRSIQEAIAYLDGCQRTPGELVNLVLITDGIPDAAEEQGTLAAAAGVAAVSPSILIHTFGIGTADARSASSLEALKQVGSGSHTMALNSSRQQAEESARGAAELVNGLYPLCFPLDETQSRHADAIIFFQDQEAEDSVSAFTKLADVPVLSSAGEVVSKAASKVPEPVETPGEKTPGENSADQGETDSQDGSETDTGVEQQTEGGKENSSSDSQEASDGGGEGQDLPKKDTSFPAAAVAAAVAVLAVLAGGYIWIRRRRPENPSAEEIYMRLEMISGQLATKEREFYLTDELRIGRGRSCDLILKDPDLTKQCARIYLADHIIWIEDTGAPDGVYLGGMRIYQANRLRSGDEISIGNTRFQFKF